MMKGDTVMDHQTTPERLARLWDHYTQAATRYEAAKKATDFAQAARDAACRACETAHQAWEAACDDEVRYGQVVRQRALAFQAASDAAFLSECGIQPDSVVPS